MLGDQLINGKHCIITVNDLVLLLYDLSLWKWTFPEGLGGVGGGGLVENYRGVRGSSAPYKNGKSREVAGS